MINISTIFLLSPTSVLRDAKQNQHYETI